MARFGVRTVIEFGCGSGIVAEGLPLEVSYLGIDANEWFLERARLRNKDYGPTSRAFRLLDVRQCHPDGQGGVRDLSMAFAFLKHFSLEEFGQILARVLAHGRYGCLGVQLLEADLDDGTEYHHTFITEEHLTRALALAGHREVEREQLWDWKHDSGGTGRSVLVWTEQMTFQLNAPRSNIQDVDWEGKALPGTGKLQQALEALPEPDISAEDIPEGQTAEEFVSVQTRDNPFLLVGGEPPFDLTKFSLRWSGTPGHEIPVLYREGRRVVAPWSLYMDVDVEADPHGGNANTE
jgi:hypothetical protein